MAVDLKDVLKEVQKKAYAADSSQDTLDLFYLLKSAVRADQNPYKEVNATLDLIAIPVLDRSPTMYYSKEDKKLYFSKDNEWQAIEKPSETWPGTNGMFYYGAGPVGANNILYWPFAVDFGSASYSNIGSLAERVARSTGNRDYTNSTNYIHGGIVYPSGSSYSSTISRHPSASTGLTATSVGNLTAPSYFNASVSSTTEGFVFISDRLPVVGQNTIVEKYTYASTVTATDAGDLTGVASRSKGITDSVNQKGYFRTTTSNKEIEGFPFASVVPFTLTADGVSSEASFTNVAAGTSSLEKGYIQTNGAIGSEKFSFADATPITISTIPGISPGRISSEGNGAASETDGYFTGRGDPTTGRTTKFPFASDFTSITVQNSVFGPLRDTGGTYGTGSHF